jgi:hypothetical protein
MKRLTMGIFAALLLISIESQARNPDNNQYYGQALCSHPKFECVKVKSSSWQKNFPDPHHRDLVQRLNRSYNYLYRGKTIVVPKDLDNTTLFDISPFPLKVKSIGEKKIIVDQNKLAWGAYDENGQLVNWGPISSGKDYCPDIGKPCKTQTGVFRVFDKQGTGCRSRTFGGARMPYCMFFYKGFALHGSHDMPGKRASHGCVRLFKDDAKWLNHHFVEPSREENDYKGTKVIVRTLSL